MFLVVLIASLSALCYLTLPISELVENASEGSKGYELERQYFCS